MGVKMAIYWDIAWVYNTHVWISLLCDPKFLYQSGYRNCSVDIETKEKHTALVQKKLKNLTLGFWDQPFTSLVYSCIFFFAYAVSLIKIMVVVNLFAVR